MGLHGGNNMEVFDHEDELNEARGLIGIIEIACLGNYTHIDKQATDWMYYTARQAGEKIDKILGGNNAKDSKVKQVITA